jgi:uncharacterized protein (DUF427 family)
MWQHKGNKRPEFAIEPGPDQESVWDYPRPPVLVSFTQRVEVKSGLQLIACSNGCMRVLETASPPTFYIPPDDINMDLLTPASGTSFCEWKGTARYWGLANAPMLPAVGWSYPDPSPRFAAIRDWLSFYPGRIECYVEGEAVQPQTGGFYGGWVTGNIVGPCKGDPGTSHW